MTHCHAPAAERRDAPIAMSREELREAGHQLVELIAELLTAMPHGPVTRDESPEALRALLGDDQLPTQGTEVSQLLRDTARLLFEHSLFNGHPRFLGYVTASPAPIGLLADFLAAAVNANTGAWRLSPMASEIESQTIRWLADLVGYPRGGGLMVSGGNMANIVALIAARRAAAPWDVQRAGVQATGPRLRVYATREAHTWLSKAVDITGLGSDCLHWIATDDSQRMALGALQSALDQDRRAGDIPAIVVATAGTVSTGAIDPLAALADICDREEVWLHVDGCYGAPAACVPGTPEDLRSLHRAASLALDPHKWLYAPLEAGALLVRDRRHLRDAFAYHPPYYHFGEEATNYVDLGPQNSRGFRALKVWLALRQVGRDGYRKMIGDDIRLARWLAERVREHGELELFTQGLSITTFRYVPPDLRERAGSSEKLESYLDGLNQEILDQIQRMGEVFVSHAIVRQRYVLRPCIVNFRTDEGDLTALLDVVTRIGRQASARRHSPP